MPKRDFTQIAFDVVQRATGETTVPLPTPRQENSRKGGLKGGVSRMESLTPEERKALSEKAAKSRWNK